MKLNPDALVWTPYIMGRSNQSHYDRAQLHTVAPREDPNEEDDTDEVGELPIDSDEPVKTNGDSKALGSEGISSLSFPI